jgi:hypothetical protein
MPNLLPMVRLFCVLNIIGLGLCFASITYTLDVMGFQNLKLKVGDKPTKETARNNEDWFVKMTSFGYDIVSACLFVYEILLTFSPKFFRYSHTGFSRAIFYLLLGLATMGRSADLGIASGIIMAFGAIATLVFNCLLKCNDRLRSDPTAQQLSDSVPVNGSFEQF